jgi:hypothetical protein
MQEVRTGTGVSSGNGAGEDRETFRESIVSGQTGVVTEAIEKGFELDMDDMVLLLQAGTVEMMDAALRAHPVPVKKASQLWVAAMDRYPDCKTAFEVLKTHKVPVDKTTFGMLFSREIGAVSLWVKSGLPLLPERAKPDMVGQVVSFFQEALTPTSRHEDESLLRYQGRRHEQNRQGVALLQAFHQELATVSPQIPVRSDHNALGALWINALNHSSALGQNSPSSRVSALPVIKALLGCGLVPAEECVKGSLSWPSVAALYGDVEATRFLIQDEVQRRHFLRDVQDIDQSHLASHMGLEQPLWPVLTRMLPELIAQGLDVSRMKARRHPTIFHGIFEGMKDGHHSGALSKEFGKVLLDHQDLLTTVVDSKGQTVLDQIDSHPSRYNSGKITVEGTVVTGQTLLPVLEKHHLEKVTRSNRSISPARPSRL